MPELPEVETSCRGIEPHLKDRQISNLIVRNHRLRWPVNPSLSQWIKGKTISRVTRRAKYILIELGADQLMVHLGMSGRVRVIKCDSPPEKHDHIDLQLSSGMSLRFTDPRRFGCWLHSKEKTFNELLNNLGPEPLSDDFSVDYLYQKTRNRKLAIKNLIMTNQVVVGVGNIYAAESLFLSGIHPKRAASQISKPRIERLTNAIKDVLSEAIKQGGTTLKDFTQSDGKPGYFKQKLHVYGREGQPCLHCQTTLKGVRLGQRATVYCPKCQR